MIKVESIAKDTVVTINDGVSIYVGQLISHEDYATLNVEEGSIVVSIDEKEVITVYSQEHKDKLREVELLKEELYRKAEEAKVPKQVEQKPKPVAAPKPSAKTPQNLHSAKTPQIFESAKSPEIFENTGSDSSSSAD